VRLHDDLEFIEEFGSDDLDEEIYKIQKKYKTVDEYDGYPEQFTDDIDKFLFLECNIKGGCCSAQGSFAYSVGREVAGKAMKYAKEQMMKDAVEATVCYGCTDNTIIPDFPIACPEEGSFIGYKKILWTKEYLSDRQFIVKLKIPEYAKRSSATTNKCRCSKAKVLEIKDMDSGETIEEITNINKKPCTYKVGEYVYPDSFDECRWNECSDGIHFFMTEQDAIDYGSNFLKYVTQIDKYIIKTRKNHG